MVPFWVWRASVHLDSFYITRACTLSITFFLALAQLVCLSILGVWFSGFWFGLGFEIEFKFGFEFQYHLAYIYIVCIDFSHFYSLSLFLFNYLRLLKIKPSSSECLQVLLYSVKWSECILTNYLNVLVAVANGCPHVKTISERFNSSTNLHKIQCSFRIGFTNGILTFKCSWAALRLYLDSFVWELTNACCVKWNFCMLRWTHSWERNSGREIGGRTK